MEPQTLPEHIGPYRVTGRLGQGGMGEVLSGHDDRLDRPVALKRIRPGGKEPGGSARSAREKARQRFRREAQIVARLNHPAIVQVYDWEEADGDDWLIMELIDGRPLDDLIRDGPLPHERAATIAREIASGLAVAHKAGLVHRDLKAANVMVTADEGTSEIKILDFGIAKRVDLEPTGGGTKPLPTTLTEAGQVIGTVRSMSPEQALGYPVDHRSDLFSLGTLLYEMLSGVSPFEGGSKVETLSRICSAREEPISDLAPNLPAGLNRLVARLLEKQPERRPADAREVALELTRLARTSSESEMPSPREMIEPSVANHEDATLEMAPIVPTTEDDRSTYATPAVSQQWRAALAGCVLIALGLSGASLWLKTRDHESTNLVTPSIADQAPVEKLSGYELYHRGLIYLDRFDQEGNLAKAIEDFQRILIQDENSAPALAGLSSAYRLDYSEGGRSPQRLEQALTVGTQAVQADEHLAAARVSLGLAYLTKGLIEESTRELEKALEIEPLNGDAWWGLAEAAEMRGDFSQAEEHFLHAIKAEPDNWLFYSHLGEFYFHGERYADSESAFLRHADLTPDSYIPFRNLGAVYYMQGRLNEAATEFQKSLQIKPDSTTYSNLGTVQFARGLYPQAVSALQQAIDSGGSTDYLLWGNLGDACRWTPDHEPRAQEAYRLAIQLLKDEIRRRPKDTNLRTFLPLYLAKLGDCDRATREISIVVELSHDHSGAGWFRIAVAFEVCDQRNKALAALETALQADYSLEDVLADPELSSLRQDAEYQRVRMNLEPAPRNE